MRNVKFLFPFILAIFLACPCFAMDVTVNVSSFKVDFGLKHTAENLMDGDTTTAWVGGGVGPGTGQWIELQFDIPMRVLRLGIFNGHQAEGMFHEFRRIRAGRVLYPDGTETAFWLRDEPGEQVVECSGKPFKSLRIVVDDVFPKGEVTAKVKLAVSEIKLYLALMGRPDEAGVETTVDLVRVPAPPPVAPDKIVPEEVIALLKDYYVKVTTLHPDLAELFSEDVRDRNDLRHMIRIEVERQRKTLQLFRAATVNTDGLGFELVQLDGSFAEVRVFGAYHVKVADLETNLEEDSVFVLSKGADGWQIVELEGEEKMF